MSLTLIATSLTGHQNDNPLFPAQKTFAFERRSAQELAGKKRPQADIAVVMAFVASAVLARLSQSATVETAEAKTFNDQPRFATDRLRIASSRTRVWRISARPMNGYH
jgi:hypothetical protein